MPDNSTDSKQVFNVVAGVRLVVAIYEAVKIVYKIAEEEWPRVKPHVKMIVEGMLKTWPPIVTRH